MQTQQQKGFSMLSTSASDVTWWPTGKLLTIILRRHIKLPKLATAENAERYLTKNMYDK